MSRAEIDPLREGPCDEIALNELEERLELQHMIEAVAGGWTCAPVDVCEVACGGGALCEFECDCYGKCECLGILR